MTKPKIKPAVLLIFDGWGIAPPGEGNMIERARTPNYDALVTTYPTFALQAASEYVGLPWGEVGNSEVGHFNIGAGQVIYQDLPKIDKDIKDKSFFSNKEFVDAIDFAKKNKGRVHLLGLFSGGKVHASDEHMIALLDLCKKEKMRDVFVHVILDGRDVERDTGKEYVRHLQQFMTRAKIGKITSVSGRFYAMDRDNHWDRIARAYDAIAHGVSDKQYDDPITAIAASYEKEVYDEEFVPVVITRGGKPIAIIEEGDAVIMTNYRADRARQITMAFVLPGFERFDRGKFLHNIAFVSMTEYDKDFPVRVAYPPIAIKHPLAAVVADAGMKQLHIAETEKYAHVTFFINGGKEVPFPGEEHILIPSKGVPNYASVPEMSAPEISQRVVEELNKGVFDFYVINFANADMVGHSGDRKATKKAVEILDKYLGEITQAVLHKKGVLFIIADHGNAEEKINAATGASLKEHSTNPVPFIVVHESLRGKSKLESPDLSFLKPIGVLADVAPTIIKTLGLVLPAEMTGQALVSL